MSRKINLLAIVGDFILFFALVILCVPFLINTTFVKDKFLYFLHEKTGISIPARNLFLHVSMSQGKPYLVTQFNDTELSISHGNRLFVGHFQTKWGIINILRGKPVCSVININDVKVDLSETNQNKTLGNMLSRDFGHIISCLPEYQKKLVLVFNNVSCQFFSSADGSCSVYRDKKILECNASIKNIFITKNQILKKKASLEFLPFQALKAGVWDLNVRTDFLNKKINVRTILKDLVINSSSLEKTLVCKSNIKLEFSGHPEKFDFHFNPLKFDFPKSILGYNLNFDKNRNPKWKMLFSGRNINVDQASTVCLALGNNNMIIKNIFDIIQAGEADNIKVSFGSNSIKSMFDPYNMTISGTLANGKIHIPTTPYLVSNVMGKAVMEKGKLKVDASSGNIDNSKLKGSHFEIDLLYPYDFPFQGRFDIDADIAQIPQVISTLLPETLVAQEMKKIKSASGLAQGSLFLDYKPGEPLGIKVDAKKINGIVDYEPFEFPMNMQKGSLYYDNQQIVISSIFATIGKNEIMDLSGRISFSPPYIMEIASGKCFIEPAKFILPFKNFSCLPTNMPNNISGKMIINSFFLKGPFFKPFKWKYEISGKAQNLEFEFPYEIDNVLTNLDMRVLSGHFFLNQDYLDWENSKKPWTKARIKKMNEGFNIQLDHMDFCDCVTKGSIFLSRKDQDIHIDTCLQIKSNENNKSPSVLSCILKDEKLLEGPCKIVCDLTYKGKVNDFQQGVEGKFSFSSINGRIYKATFLERILSVINFINLGEIRKKGFNYNSMKLDGRIRNGKLFLSNAFIDAENMLLVFTGWVDIFKNKLDLVCFVAPLKTLDSVIKEIPLLNLLIGDKIISIPVGIRGNLNKPDIVMLDPSDIGKGVLNLIEHVLTTPIRLFNGDKALRKFDYKP